MLNTHIVIMAGGIGSRLWPLSTPERPKQFIDVLGVGKSLIQLTYERFLPLAAPDHFWVVTSAAYREEILRQLPDLPEDQLLLEPCARNTAPCIAYACSKIALRHPDAQIIVTPSDALVLQTERFASILREALRFTAGGQRIVTIGITPTRPECGYGYIQARKAVQQMLVPVDAFKEKPDAETAKAYLADGRYFWNAGIFVWSAETILSELSVHVPAIMEIMDRLSPSLYTDREAEALAALFPSCEKISIDYAVMEKTDKAYVIAADLGWSDLGNWSAIHAQLAHDPQDNSHVGPVRLYDCSGTLAHCVGEKQVILCGLDHYIVAETGGCLLICPLEREQEIKKFVENA